MLVRRARSGWGGALSTLALAAFLGLMLFNMVTVARLGGRSPFGPEAMRHGFPALLLFSLVMTFMSGQTLRFTRAEIDFLFPAPVSRSQLLLYHLGERGAVHILSGLFIGLMLFPGAASLPAALLGASLGFLTVHVLSEWLALLAVKIGPRIPSGLRRVALPGGVILALAAIALTTRLPVDGAAFRPIRELTANPVIATASLPFRPAAQILLAGSLGELFAWTALALVLLVAMVLATVRLDVAFHERALATRARLDSRGTRTSWLWRQPTARATSTGPQLAHALGAFGPTGTLAWRQVLEIRRSPGYALRLLLQSTLIVGVVLVPALMSPQLRSDGVNPQLTALGAVSIAILFPLLTAHLPYGFHADLERMPYLKSLPVGPAFLAAGQVLPTVLLTIGVQTLTVAAIALVVRALPVLWLGAMLVALVPVAWSAVAIDQILLLLYPRRTRNGETPSPQFIGAVMFATLIKFVLLTIILAVCAGVGFAVYLTTSLVPLGAAAAFLGLVGFAGFVTWLIAMTFDGFDVSRDTPLA